MFGYLREKLKKTRETITGRFDELLKGSQEREEILDELMETMILADVGIQTTEKIIGSIKAKSKKTDSFEKIKSLLKEEILNLFSSQFLPQKSFPIPFISLFVGVNGGGKTTSLAKLAHMLKKQGKEVLMVAADTFRAAAQEQLSLWGKKLNIPVIQGRYQSDPAAVVFDAIQSFQARRCQALLIDTAGRIHTNTNLMNELEKIKKVINREIEGAPHEILLVLDASIGQNALVQAREFLKFSGLTGIFLTKLDGTAKGGSVLAIADELDLPIKWIGVGEGENDILPFSPKEFTYALLGTK